MSASSSVMLDHKGLPTGSAAPARPIIQVLPPPVLKAEPDNSAAITAYATVALVLATGVLAYLTWVLARATNRASVIATIEPDPQWLQILELHIFNEGNATAYGVTVTFDPPLPTSSVSGSRAIVYPDKVSLLVAGQRIVSFLGQTKLMVDQKYKVTVGWKRRPTSRSTITSTYDLDLSYLNFLRTRRTKDIGEQLDAMSKTMDRLAGFLMRGA